MGDVCMLKKFFPPPSSSFGEGSLFSLPLVVSAIEKFANERLVKLLVCFVHVYSHFPVNFRPEFPSQFSFHMMEKLPQGYIKSGEKN